MSILRTLKSACSKRHLKPKLIVLTILTIIGVVALSNFNHVDTEGHGQKEASARSLRTENFVVDRKVLNANVDNQESLKAPSTEDDQQPVPLLTVPNSIKRHQGLDRPKNNFKQMYFGNADNEGNGFNNVPQPARVVTRGREGQVVEDFNNMNNGLNNNNRQYQQQEARHAPNPTIYIQKAGGKVEKSYQVINSGYDQQKTYTKESQYHNPPGAGDADIQAPTVPVKQKKHDAQYYADYDATLAKKRKNTPPAWRRDSNHGPTEFAYHQVADWERRQKVKQWENYDYENPYNLLQIHVDRAPEHADAIGQPWPMPQTYLSESTRYPIDMVNFQIIGPTSTCGRVVRAIDRYTKHINSQVDIFVPNGETLQRPSGSFIIKQLIISMSRQCDDQSLPHENMSEQYKLDINEKGATLSAQEPWGVIRGLETFSQIMYYHDGQTVINATFIKDFPRFRYRGLMLDTARHYIPVKHIKRMLDAMSYTKLNVFHWHMVDDQSFPYVSNVFPKLSKLGAYSQSQIYSPEVIHNLIEYAADRAIRVIPEFDSPGHTRSWGLGYPDLLTNCSADHFPFGAVNPISEYTYKFMKTFWAEIHDRYPDSMVHVGGDEINYKCWLRVKKIRDFMIANNMTQDQYDYLTLDGDKLQGYYLKHLLASMPKDRKKIAWEEAFNAALHWNVSTDELIINVWKGGDYEWQNTIDNVVRHGYKAILSAPWYLNYISYGRDWTKYYAQDPQTFLMYSSGTESYKDLVIGGQVCMWAEFIDEANLEPTLWPRAIAPAEKFWSSAQQDDWRKAENRFENHRCRMSRRGIRTQPNSGPGSCKGKMRIKPPYDAGQQF